MRVLLAGHKGLPFGGLATYCESLLTSSLKDNVALFFVETSLGGTDISSRGGWRIHNYINALQNIFRFLTASLHTRPHVVHIMTAQMPSMLKNGLIVLLARLLGSKVIIHPHCSVQAMFSGDVGWRNRFTDFIFQRCHGILVLSEEWLALQDRFGKSPLCHIPNGIDLSPYLAIPRPGQSRRSKPVNVLYLGHLGAEKGIFDLLEAVRLLNDLSGMFKITLVGEPFNRQEGIEIVSLIEKYHLQEFVSVFPPEYGEEKINRLSQADIYILPSHYEGMPISIIESMAAGLPTIATTVGGITDMLVHNKTGLLVPPGNPDALATAIRTLIHSSSSRLQMGYYARELSRSKYDIEQIVPQLLEFYRYIESQP